MNNLRLLPILLLLSISCFSQTNEEILKELNDLKSTSEFKVGIGVGNKIFSTRNNKLNSQQNSSSLVFTPSLSYFHKSGLSLTATGYDLHTANKSGFLQYAVNPAYDYSGTGVSATISYTHYFVNGDYNTALTPIQNDFFGSITSKKGWLQPGLQLGFSSGQYKEITNVDTTVRTAGIPTHYQFIDSSTIKLQSFSVTGTFEHDFTFHELFSKEDDFSFIPQLMINFGSSKEDVLQSTSGNYSFLVNRKKLKRKLKTKNQTNSSTAAFTLESIGLNLEGAYQIGKFSVQPDLYFDYFIPASTGKKLSTIYSINLYYSF